MSNIEAADLISVAATMGCCSDPGSSIATVRKGDWIQTFLGLRFYPLDPRPEDVDARDIAHALANKCRFTGHTRRFYSVAEHSLLVARAFSRSASPTERLWALLHDAAEAYLPDVARPIKADLIGFQEIEDRVLRCVAQAFELPWPMPPSIAAVDLRALKTEAEALMPKPEEFSGLADVALIDTAWDFDVRGLTPSEAESEFLSVLEGLRARRAWESAGETPTASGKGRSS